MVYNEKMYAQTLHQTKQSSNNSVAWKPFSCNRKKVTRDFLPCLRHVLLIQQCADK